MGTYTKNSKQKKISKTDDTSQSLRKKKADESKSGRWEVLTRIRAEISETENNNNNKIE